MNKLIEVKNLKIYFEQRNGFLNKAKTLYAVDDISFDVYKGEVLGIVGESGCGKSTLVRALVGLNKITNGSVIFNGKDDFAKIDANRWHELRKDIQFVFQDPVASLNPRMSIAEIIAEPLKVYCKGMNKKLRLEKVLAMMKLVGLSSNHINRYPQEFSGGQCQRVGIARALILEPKLLICDESVSALDVSIKAQIINLLKDLQQQLNLTIVFVSHDLSVVKHICDRVLVMYLGNIMELATKDIIYNAPHNPYTKALLEAIPIANPKFEKNKKINTLEGELPLATNPPVGCVFNTRCSMASDICKPSRPLLKSMPDGGFVACFKA